MRTIAATEIRPPNPWARRVASLLATVACLATVILAGCPASATPPKPTSDAADYGADDESAETTATVDTYDPVSPPLAPLDLPDNAGRRVIAVDLLHPPTAASVLSQGTRYRHDVRTVPRPLHIHSLVIDLLTPGLEFAAAIPPDPDGADPADSSLVPPLTLAAQHHLLAAINANAFAPLPDMNGFQTDQWYSGMPVEIHSLAVADGEVRKRPKPWFPGIWSTQDGAMHLGQPDAATVDSGAIRAGGAGFAWILQNGKVVGPTGGELHPRTAVGLDRSARFLYFVIVDGRQPGYSEGVTTEELGHYLADLGASDALNLDGGGSSILLLSDENGELRTMNSPSRRALGLTFHRPVPVMIGIRFAKP